MEVNKLVELLRKVKIETGSMACLGCGYEHNCSLHGCAILREAADTLEQLNDFSERRCAKLLTENKQLQRDLLLMAQAEDVCVFCAHCCMAGSPLYRPAETYMEYCDRCDDAYSCFQWRGLVTERGEAHEN